MRESLPVCTYRNIVEVVASLAVAEVEHRRVTVQGGRIKHRSVGVVSVVEQALCFAEAIVLDEAASFDLDLSVSFDRAAGRRDGTDLGRVIVSERQLTRLEAIVLVLDDQGNVASCRERWRSAFDM